MSHRRIRTSDHLHARGTSDLGEAMSTDPVVDEVRAIRDAIAREHDYDIAAICRAIRERTRAAGIETVTLPPRPVSRVPDESDAQQAFASDEDLRPATPASGPRR